MNPGDLDAAERTRLNLEAMLHQAPDVPGMELRPFNDTVLALCGEAGLTLFTMEALQGTGSNDVAGMTQRAESLGMREINRQCLCLLFIVGFPDKKQMLSAVRRKDFYEECVLPWSLDLPSSVGPMPRLLGEWQRYMLHTAAAIVQVLPKDKGEADKDAPPN